MVDSERTEEAWRDVGDWLLIALATCVGLGSVILGVWLTAIAMGLGIIAAGQRLRRRHTPRTGTTPRP